MATLILRRLHFVLLAVLSICGLCVTSSAMAGVVGTGTPASCTESALATQIAAGGTVTFNCGGAATIAMTTGIGISSSGPALVVDGGGVITLDGATISPHQPMISVQGGSSALPSITFKGLTFSNGNATGTGLQAGGAILNGGNLTLDHDVFTNNQAPFGGAVMQERCSSIGAPPTPCIAASLTVTNSEFSGNSASNSGGAINLQSDTVNVSNSTFTGNSAGSGGAIYLYGNSTFTTSGTITSSTFSGNTVTFYGGGIAVVNLQGGSATITNNTFNANQATGAGAGGAIWVGSPTTSTNNTIAGNSAPSGGGISNGAKLTMQDTLLANNAGGNCAGSSFSGANNLQFGDSSCSGVAVADPHLGALANNGGPTQTMALNSGSAAIDAGNNGTCASVDQRGIARPQGTNCDIGAYEAPPTVVVPVTAPPISAPTLSWAALLLLAGLSATLGLSARRMRV